MKKKNKGIITYVKKQGGFGLFEMILVIMVLGIAVAPIVNLMRSNIVNSAQAEQYNKANLIAKQRMEQVISDYNNPARGYNYIASGDNYSSRTVDGYASSVSVATGTYNSMPYAEVTVTVSRSGISNVELKMWFI